MSGRSCTPTSGFGDRRAAVNTTLIRRIEMVWVESLELPTSRSQSARSSVLSYTQPWWPVPVLPRLLKGENLPA